MNIAAKIVVEVVGCHVAFEYAVRGTRSKAPSSLMLCMLDGNGEVNWEFLVKAKGFERVFELYAK